MLRYTLNIGDLADRNFLNVHGTIYGIDEDAPKKGALGKPGKLLNKTRSKLITDWLLKSSNWALMEKFINQLNTEYDLNYDQVSTIDLFTT